MNGGETREFLLMLRCVLVQKGTAQHEVGEKRKGPDGFIGMEEAALDEAIYCVERVHGMKPRIGTEGYYRVRIQGSVFKTRMDIIWGRNRLRNLLNIYKKSGGVKNNYWKMIQEAIRCMEIIHAEELGKDCLYKNLERVE